MGYLVTSPNGNSGRPQQKHQESGDNGALPGVDRGLTEPQRGLSAVICVGIYKYKQHPLRHNATEAYCTGGALFVR